MKQMKTKTVEVSRDLLCDIMIELKKYHPTNPVNRHKRWEAIDELNRVLLAQPKPRKWWQINRKTTVDLPRTKG